MHDITNHLVQIGKASPSDVAALLLLLLSPLLPCISSNGLLSAQPTSSTWLLHLHPHQVVAGDQGAVFPAAAQQ